MSWARRSGGAGARRFRRLAPRPPAPDASALTTLVRTLHRAGLMSDGCFGLMRGGECLLLFPHAAAACAFVGASLRGAAATGAQHQARWGVAHLGCGSGSVLIAFPACTTEAVVAWTAAGLP